MWLERMTFCSLRIHRLSWDNFLHRQIIDNHPLKNCNHSTKKVHSFSNNATIYTIFESGVDTPLLNKTVTKHWENLHRYWIEKPIATHTQDAFSALQEQLQGNQRPIILDSGCGTGRSSEHLGTLYPGHLVIGVDRSLARLQRNYVYRQQSTDAENNVHLIRAELTDFWRLWLTSPLGIIERHFLLYPNPYPKKSRYMSRWYAHPAFPLLLRVGGDELVVRSNWKAYLNDFALAVSLVRDLDASQQSSYEASHLIQLDPSKVPWTNFEAKYFHVGEPSYELLLRKREE